MTLKKNITLLTVAVCTLALSGCCLFMRPAEPVKPEAVVLAPEVVAPAVVAPVVVETPAAPVDSDKDGVIDSADKCPNTKIGVAVDSNGCPVATKEKVRIAIGVLFATNKADIKEDSTEDIKKLGVFMQSYPETTTVVEGHTDNVGTAAMNKALSQRRADAVRDYLIKNYGIDPSRINAVGYGFDRPIADNATAEGRQKNRRTVAEIDTFVVKP